MCLVSDHGISVVCVCVCVCVLVGHGVCWATRKWGAVMSNWPASLSLTTSSSVDSRTDSIRHSTSGHLQRAKGNSPLSSLTHGSIVLNWSHCSD